MATGEAQVPGRKFGLLPRLVNS